MNEEVVMVGYETDGKARSKVAAAAFICIGLLLAGFFPGYYYYKTYKTANSVTVKGLSEMEAKADMAMWTFKFKTAGDTLATLNSKMGSQLKEILGFLSSIGFENSEIKVESLSVVDKRAQEYGGEGGLRYVLSQQINVRSAKVDLVEKASSEIGALVSRGILFDFGYYIPVKYTFTSLNSVKSKMLEEAIKNAKEAAEEFAKASGAKIGRIRKASQGVFSILPRDGDKGQEEQSVDKKIRVVSTVEYWLE